MNEPQVAVVAQGITDKTVADQIAAQRRGKVVTDKDDPKKFMVVTEARFGVAQFQDLSSKGNPQGVWSPSFLFLKQALDRGDALGAREALLGWLFSKTQAETPGSVEAKLERLLSLDQAEAYTELVGAIQKGLDPADLPDGWEAVIQEVLALIARDSAAKDDAAADTLRQGAKAKRRRFLGESVVAPKVVLEVQGGVVAEVYGSNGVDVMIVDWDNDADGATGRAYVVPLEDIGADLRTAIESAEPGFFFTPPTQEHLDLEESQDRPPVVPLDRLAKYLGVDLPSAPKDVWPEFALWLCDELLKTETSDDVRQAITGVRDLYHQWVQGDWPGRPAFRAAANAAAYAGVSKAAMAEKLKTLLGGRQLHLALEEAQFKDFAVGDSFYASGDASRPSGRYQKTTPEFARHLVDGKEVKFGGDAEVRREAPSTNHGINCSISETQRISKAEYQRWLNEMPASEVDSRGPDDAPAGDWLRRNDPIAFSVGYGDWVAEIRHSENQERQKEIQRRQDDKARRMGYGAVGTQGHLGLDEATNQDVIELFLRDSFPKTRHSWGSQNLKITKENHGWSLVNYNTRILHRPDGGSTYFNEQRYSNTTNKIQGKIRYMARAIGLDLVSVDGRDINAIAWGEEIPNDELRRRFQERQLRHAENQRLRRQRLRAWSREQAKKAEAEQKIQQVFGDSGQAKLPIDDEPLMESLLFVCPSCQRVFDYNNTPECCMGAVKCPHCERVVSQGGL